MSYGPTRPARVLFGRSFGERCGLALLRATRDLQLLARFDQLALKLLDLVLEPLDGVLQLEGLVIVFDPALVGVLVEL